MEKQKLILDLIFKNILTTNNNTEIIDNYFITKLNNKYGLIYITPETIKKNKFVLLENIYEIISVFPTSPNAPFFKVGLKSGQATNDYFYNENGIAYDNKSNQTSSDIIIGNQIKFYKLILFYFTL